MLRLGKAYLRIGHLNDAFQLAERALNLSSGRKERGSQARALRLLGEIAMHREPPSVEQAEAHHRQALALAEELGMRPLLAHCHLGLGTLYTQVDRPAQARAELSTAIALYRAMEMMFWLPGAKAALASVAGSGSRDPGSAQRTSALDVRRPSYELTYFKCATMASAGAPSLPQQKTLSCSTLKQCNRE
jgi:tetratricopeptide (TPR) repeat protein